MNKYKHVLAFDLSSYGAALSIINQFVDDQSVKVFEVSPSGQTAILILVSQDLIGLQVIKSEAISYYRSEILEFSMIENIHEEVMPVYLSQNKPGVSKSLVILEGPFVSTALAIADQLVNEKNLLLDFRVVRTGPKNVILTVGAEDIGYFQTVNLHGFKKTIIENIQPSLKAFFEI